MSRRARKTCLPALAIIAARLARCKRSGRVLKKIGNEVAGDPYRKHPAESCPLWLGLPVLTGLSRTRAGCGGLSQPPARRSAAVLSEGDATWCGSGDGWSQPGCSASAEV